MDFKKEIVQESHAQRKKITELLRKMTKVSYLLIPCLFTKGYKVIVFHPAGFLSHPI